MAGGNERVIVVGGGLQGCAIAYELHKTHGYVDITIVEAEDAIAAGASGKGGGFLAKTWGDDITNSLHEIGYEQHAILSKELSIKSYHVLKGTLKVRATPASTVTPQRKRRKMNGVAWLNEDACTVEFMSDETAQVDPAEVCMALLEASQATVVQATVVGITTKKEYDGDDNKLDKDAVASLRVKDGNDIVGDTFVFCLGPWSGVLESEAFFGRRIRVPMIGIKSSSIIVAPASPSILDDSKFACFCEEDENGCHLELYPRNDGTLYVCGLGGSDHIFSDGLIEPGAEYDQASKVHENQTRVDAALKSLVRLTGREWKVVSARACLRPLLSDGYPMMGRFKDVRNAYVSCGHNCWGILWSLSQGKAMGDLIATGNSRDVDLSPFALDRFL